MPHRCLSVQQKNRVKDFREGMIKYLEAMMDSQQQVCFSYLKGFDERCTIAAIRNKNENLVLSNY